MSTLQYHNGFNFLLKVFLLFYANLLIGQAQADFLGQWNGQEDLESEAISYTNRNISVHINEGGVREGFYVFESSCDFLFNESLDWAFHYFKFDKENNQLTFLRRFITPVGILGYEELVYDLLEWSSDFFVAQYFSQNRQTNHHIRMTSNILDIMEPIPAKFFLGQNYPNPFNPNTFIKVYLDKLSFGKVKIFNINGELVKSLHDGFFFPGETVLDWNGENSLGQKVASGSYVYNLYINGDLKGSQIMTFVK